MPRHAIFRVIEGPLVLSFFPAREVASADLYCTSNRFAVMLLGFILALTELIQVAYRPSIFATLQFASIIVLLSGVNFWGRKCENPAPNVA